MIIDKDEIARAKTGFGPHLFPGGQFHALHGAGLVLLETEQPVEIAIVVNGCAPMIADLISGQHPHLSGLPLAAFFCNPGCARSYAVARRAKHDFTSDDRRCSSGRSVFNFMPPEIFSGFWSNRD